MAILITVEIVVVIVVEMVVGLISAEVIMILCCRVHLVPAVEIFHILWRPRSQDMDLVGCRTLQLNPNPKLVLCRMNLEMDIANCLVANGPHTKSRRFHQICK